MLNLSHNQKEVGLGRWQQGRAIRTGKSREIMGRFNSHSVRCCWLYTNLVKYSGGSRRASISRYLVERYGLDSDVQIHYICARKCIQCQSDDDDDTNRLWYNKLKSNKEKQPISAQE